MKKVIDGKLYNTETATLIDSWCNYLPTNDFRSCEESLYQTKKGVFFLHGKGGAISKYAVEVRGGTGHGQTIIPLTRSEAIQWCERYDLVETLEKHFQDDIQEA